MPKHSFWKEIWNAWCKLSYEQNIANLGVLNKNVWLYSQIKIGGKAVIFRNWYKAGIMWINDICTEEDERLFDVLTKEELGRKYQLRTTPLQYIRLLHSMEDNYESTRGRG